MRFLPLSRPCTQALRSTRIRPWACAAAALLWSSRALEASSTAWSVTEPDFSQPGGFYAHPFVLTLSCADPDARLLYTLDGSEPDEANLEGRAYRYKREYPQDPGDPFGPLLTATDQTHLYADALPIADRSAEPDQLTGHSSTWHRSPDHYVPLGPVFKGTVVRARATKPGARPSRVVTHTYFVTPAGADRYQLPVVALAIPAPCLFDYEIGTYVAGVDFDRWRETAQEPAHALSGANYWRAGDAAEHPVHFEWFEEGQGTRAFAQDLGFRIHGGGSVTFPQKSLRLYARTTYDSRSTLEYEFFPGLVDRVAGAPLRSFRRLVLRNAGQDTGMTRFRDAFVQALFEPLGLDRQAYQPTVHFINGEFWGLINLRERIDRYYLASHHRLDPDDVALLSYDGYLEEGTEADREDYLALREYIATHDLADPRHLAYVAERMDLNNFLHYQLAEIYSMNGDWPYNNNRFWRRRTPDRAPGRPATHDGRWRWILYDLDSGYYGVDCSFDMLEWATAPDSPNPGNPPASTVMLRRLLENPEFRRRFINAFMDQMNTLLLPGPAVALVDRLHARIAPHLAEHAERWRYMMSSDPQFMKDFAHRRPAWMRQHLLRFFQLADETAGPTLFAEDFESWSGAVPEGWSAARPEQVQPETAGAYQGQRALRLQGHGLHRWSDRGTVLVRPLLLAERRGRTARISGAVKRLSGEGALWLGPRYGITASLVEITPTDAWQPFSRLFSLDWLAGEGDFTLSASAELDCLLDDLRIEEVDFPDGTAPVTLDVTVPGQGHFRLNTIEITPATPGLPDPARPFPWSGLYFRQVPVTVTALPAAGYRFGGWLELPEATESTLEFLPGAHPVLTARFLPAFEVEPVAECWPLIEGGGPATLELSAVFADPSGATLGYEIQAEPDGVVNWTLAGPRLQLWPRMRGETRVRIVASDDRLPGASVSFRVLVYPQAWPLRQGAWTFDAWEPGRPEGEYPEHILFLQSDRSDPDLETPLDHAYWIPHDDYHADDQGSIGYPYNNTGRTRINGLGEAGVSFVNTGRDRDLGGVLLAVDTRGVTAAEVGWLAQTVQPNQRPYAWRLQYRVGTTGAFADVRHEGRPVEYVAGAEGDVQRLGPVALPPAAVGVEYLQLLWRYHHVSGSSGPRAALRLDEVRVAERRDASEPALSVALLVGGQVILSWPAALAGYRVETSQQVGPRAVWTPVITPATRVGNRWVLVVEPGEDTRFFRLRPPAG